MDTDIQPYIDKAIEELQIPHPKTVIVLVGGAAGIGWWDKFNMRKAVGTIARLAEETRSVVVGRWRDANRHHDRDL